MARRRVRRARLSLSVARSGRDLRRSNADGCRPHSHAGFSRLPTARHLHGVVDLAGFLGTRGDTPRDNRGWSAFNQSLDINCVLLVDRLSGAREDELSGRGRSDDRRCAPAFAGARLRDASRGSGRNCASRELAGDESFPASSLACGYSTDNEEVHMSFGEQDQRLGSKRRRRADAARTAPSRPRRRLHPAARGPAEPLPQNLPPPKVEAAPRSTRCRSWRRRRSPAGRHLGVAVPSERRFHRGRAQDGDTGARAVGRHCRDGERPAAEQQRILLRMLASACRPDRS